MTKKIPLGIVIAIVLISILFSSVITAFVFVRNNSELLNDLPQRASQYIKLSDIDELVRNEYYGSIDASRIDSSLTNGYLIGLNDPYCYYISQDEKEEHNRFMAGLLSGTGITAYFDSDSGYLRISYVSPDSPASNAGLTTELFITSVNGKTVSSENSDDIISELSESFDKKLKLTTIDIADPTKSSDFEIVSGYRAKSCYSSINGNIGYIRLSALYEDTYSSFISAIDTFTEKGISSLILDLRNSSANDLDIASQIIDRIVPVGDEGTGNIFTAKNSSGELIHQVSSDAQSLNMKIAVLINSRTDGAPELIACDLRDFGKAVLIGEQTVGRGTMQKMFSMEDGGAVSLTVAEVFPYISDSFNNIGVKPDIEIVTSESFKNQIEYMDGFDDDEQYQKAISYLNGN